MPGTDQAPLGVDVTLGKVRTQVSAATGNRVAAPVDVQHRPTSNAANASGAELLDRAYELLADAAVLFNACQR